MGGRDRLVAIARQRVASFPHLELMQFVLQCFKTLRGVNLYVCTPQCDRIPIAFSADVSRIHHHHVDTRMHTMHTMQHLSTSNISTSQLKAPYPGTLIDHQSDLDLHTVTIQEYIQYMDSPEGRGAAGAPRGIASKLSTEVGTDDPLYEDIAGLRLRIFPDDVDAITNERQHYETAEFHLGAIGTGSPQDACHTDVRICARTVCVSITVDGFIVLDVPATYDSCTIGVSIAKLLNFVNADPPPPHPGRRPTTCWSLAADSGYCFHQNMPSIRRSISARG